MTLRHMKIFAAVCESGSITIAAKKLNFSQPAVSLAIKELETYYGVTLFDRISRRLYLTEAGRQFLTYATQIVSMFDEMETGIRDWDSFGLLRIGASITVGTCLMPDYAERFSKTHPNLKLHVTVDNSNVLVGKILQNELDFALIEGASHAESILSEPFFEDELTLVCGASHPFAKRSEVSLAELAKEPLILREKGSGTRDLFDSTMLVRGLTLSPAWESISTEAIVAAVAKGIGVSVLPVKLVRRELDEGRLVSLSIRGVSFKRTFNIIYHRDKFLSSSAKAFIALCLASGKNQPL